MNVCCSLSFILSVPPASSPPPLKGKERRSKKGISWHCLLTQFSQKTQNTIDLFFTLSSWLTCCAALRWTQQIITVVSLTAYESLQLTLPLSVAIVASEKNLLQSEASDPTWSCRRTSSSLPEQRKDLPTLRSCSGGFPGLCRLETAVTWLQVSSWSNCGPVRGSELS